MTLYRVQFNFRDGNNEQYVSNDINFIRAIITLYKLYPIVKYTSRQPTIVQSYHIYERGELTTLGIISEEVKYYPQDWPDSHNS